MQPDLTNGLLWYIAFLYSTTCHESAHALAALKLGDDTAARGGQVSLNPWPHLRRAPVGMVMVPIVSWLAGGWIIGWASTPFSPEWAHRFPRRLALMALAGPAANLALLAVAAGLLRLGLEWHQFSVPFWLNSSRIVDPAGGGLMPFAAHALSIVFSLNLLLLVFNLLPVPPLDGSSLPLLLLPESAATKYFALLRSPIVRMVGLLVIFRTSGAWFGPLLHRATSLLFLGLVPA